nr:CARB-PSE [uncultured bacterium]
MKQGLVFLYFLICVIYVQAAVASEDPVLEAARQAEAQLDARVGLAVYDTGSGANWLFNADGSFPMGSTFKVLACGVLLARADAGDEDLDRFVEIVQTDLVTYSPVTETWVGRNVSLGEICAATMRTSDNTAANKVLEALGGPGSLTAFLRSLGDQTTRLDRWETDLNEGTPGDPRDTTSPAAMAASFQKFVLGDVLSTSSRETLTDWLLGNEVGGPLLRAGLPEDWRIGDRTGAGGHGSRGIVAVLWPPGRAPLIAAIYLTETQATLEGRDAAIAAIGRAIAETIAGAP